MASLSASSGSGEAFDVRDAGGGGGAGPEQASSLLGHPLRLKILEHLAEPDSAAGLSRRLGVPRQVVNYHLRALESAGVVEFVEERPRGGLKERVMRATARSYLISPEAMGAVEPDPRRLRDRFSWAYLVAAAAKVVRDLGILRHRADRAGKRLATFTLETEVRFASAADRDAFTRELAARVAELAVKYHDEQAPRRGGCSGSCWVPTRRSPRRTRRPRPSRIVAAPLRLRPRSPSDECEARPVVREAVRGRGTRGGRLEGDHRGRGAHPVVLPGGDLRARRRRQASRRLGRRRQGDAVITAWEPGVHLRTESRPARPVQARGPEPYAIDWYLEHEGGVTRVRMVASGFGEGPQWDHEYDGTFYGWDLFHKTMKHYLEHHRGQPVGNVVLYAVLAVPPAEAWARLMGPDGLVRRGVSTTWPSARPSGS